MTNPPGSDLPMRPIGPLRRLATALVTGHRIPFIRSVFFAGSGTGVSQVILFAALPVLTQLYSPSDFGSLALYVAAVGFASFLATLQLETAVLVAPTLVKALRLVVIGGDAAIGHGCGDETLGAELRGIRALGVGLGHAGNFLPVVSFLTGRQ